MIRAVLDTSALFSPRLRRQLQEAAAQGLYTGIWSPWIIAELNRVLVALDQATSRWRHVTAHTSAHRGQSARS